jgi:predicted Zn-dependent peptidase
VTIERTEFDSGLRVITERMPGVRSVALGFWVATGSRDETGPYEGSSHFLEHLLFKGTKKRTARDIAEAFDSVGGDLNAFTSKEATCFYARALDKHLPMVVEHMCDMLQHSLIDATDFESERKVVLEEINMRDDTPDDLIHDLFAETVWPEHPLGKPVLGTRESISSVSAAQVRRYWRKRYVPGNIVVVVAGNARHEDVIGLVRKGMETGRRLRPGAGGKAMRSPGRAPMSSGATRVTKRKTEQAHICVGTDGLSRTDPDRFAFGIVSDALGGGMSSRLFQEIREKRGLAYSVYCYQQQFAETGLFSVYAGTTPQQARQVLDLARHELEDVAQNGLNEAEFERGKGHMKGSLVLSLEDTSGRMSRLGKSEMAHGEILSVDQVLKRVDSVTLDDARRVAARVLSQPMSLTVIGPFDRKSFA